MDLVVQLGFVLVAGTLAVGLGRVSLKQLQKASGSWPYYVGLIFLPGVGIALVGLMLALLIGGERGVLMGMGTALMAMAAAEAFASISSWRFERTRTGQARTAQMVERRRTLPELDSALAATSKGSLRWVLLSIQKRLLKLVTARSSSRT